MNPKVYLALALTACAVNSAVALFGTSVGLTASSVGTGLGLGGTLNGAAIGTTALVSGSGILLAAGIIGLKAIAISSVLSNSRGKRSANEDSDLAFLPVAATEPAACIKRFICDLATGTQPRSENDVILALFNKPTSAASPKFAFAEAASLGKISRQVRTCEVRYSCPLSGAQISKLFN
jgi:hypothetical protein